MYRMPADPRFLSKLPFLISVLLFFSLIHNVCRSFPIHKMCRNTIYGKQSRPCSFHSPTLSNSVFQYVLSKSHPHVLSVTEKTAARSMRAWTHNKFQLQESKPTNDCAPERRVCVRWRSADTKQFYRTHHVRSISSARDKSVDLEKRTAE